MRDDDTLFGKADTTKADAEAADAEQAEALSRAAREAVRQPADPRIEKSFAHLGESADAEPRRPVRGPGPGTGVAVGPAPAAETADLEAIRAELAAWRTSAGDLNRRLDIVTWILLGLTGIIGLLAIVLIVRG